MSDGFPLSPGLPLHPLAWLGVEAEQTALPARCQKGPWKPRALGSRAPARLLGRAEMLRSASLINPCCLSSNDSLGLLGGASFYRKHTHKDVILSC